MTSKISLSPFHQEPGTSEPLRVVVKGTGSGVKLPWILLLAPPLLCYNFCNLFFISFPNMAPMFIKFCSDACVVNPFPNGSSLL